jgi:hypothetical protein
MLGATATTEFVDSKVPGSRPHEPRAMLIVSRVNFDAAVHAPLVNFMNERYGTKAFIFVGRAAIAEKWRKWVNGRAILIVDEELRARAQLASENWAQVQAVARSYEQKYDLTYMRDILHQDKVIAAYYLQHSPGSAFARQKPPALPYLVALLNLYFATIEGLIASHPIDLILARSSGLFNSVAIAVARKKHIPVSWLNHTRVGKQMIWMEGPDHSPNLIRSHYPKAESVELLDSDDIVPPPDATSARAAANHDTKFSRLFFDLLRHTIDRILMRARDLSRGGWPQRLPLHGLITQYFMRWRVARYLIKRAKGDENSLTRNRYVLFLLHLDPEYTSSTLARHFNHTHAIIQQLALSLPAGFVLAIKEHVIGLGNRRLSFYKELSCLPNLVFVDYRLKATDIARDAAAVATVWGTICLEASLMGVPVICFTEKSEFSILQNIITVRSPTEISRAVQQALEERSPSDVLAVRREAAQFRQGQLGLSFHMAAVDMDEHGNRNRDVFELGLSQAELREAADKLLAVYRAGGGTSTPII